MSDDAVSLEEVRAYVKEFPSRKDLPLARLIELVRARRSVERPTWGDYDVWREQE